MKKEQRTYEPAWGDMDLSGLTAESRKKLVDVAAHFNQALAYLIMQQPFVFGHLMVPNGNLPDFVDIRYALDHATRDPRNDSMTGFVFSTLYALNVLDNDEGSILYRHLFVRREKDRWHETFSHSSFYRISQKAIDGFFLNFALVLKTWTGIGVQMPFLGTTERERNKMQ